MTKAPGFPQGRSIRLRAFDYRTPGCYVVTICTQHRVHLFGTIVDGEMHSSRSGQMVRGTRNEIPSFYPDGDDTAGQLRLSLIDVVERFKSLTTKRYGDGVRSDGWPPYPGKLWQRDYYERVVRNEAELTRFRNYIEANPARWFEDPYRGE